MLHSPSWAAFVRITSLSLALAVTNCGPGVNVAGPSGGAAMSGVVNVPSLTVSTGQTLTVSGPVFINSAGPVQIDGTMSAKPGASVVIVASSFALNGALATNDTVGIVASTITMGSSATIGTPPSSTASGQSTARRAKDQGTSGAGGSVNFNSPNGTITIGGIYGMSGQDASQQAAPNTPGGATNGGNVEIGTVQAVTNIGAAAALAGKSFSGDPTPPQNVTITAPVVGGFGGHGYDDVNGTLSGTTVALMGTGGANGGDVNIVATKTVTISVPVQGGYGGFGGRVGFGASRDFTTAVDAISPGANGVSMVATTGDGGNGGSVDILSPATSGSSIGGTAGDGGSIKFARAGNGGPGGNGGTTTVTLGRLGKNGDPQPQGLRFAAPLVELSGGGSGGASIDAQHSGGAGGSVVITLPSGYTPPVPGFWSITNYANGANGFPNCPNAGTNAGNPGSLTIPFQTYTVKNSFNGANGGQGSPPGTASLGGKDNFGTKIGQDGLPGNLCNGTPNPTATPTPAPSASVMPTPSPSPAPTPTPSGTPSPVASGTYGIVIVTPPSITFTGIGNSQTVTATQSGNSGNTFTAGPISCPPGTGGTASITQPSPGTFVLTETSKTSSFTCAGSIMGLGGQVGTFFVTF